MRVRRTRRTTYSCALPYPWLVTREERAPLKARQPVGSTIIFNRSASTRILSMSWASLAETAPTLPDFEWPYPNRIVCAPSAMWFSWAHKHPHLPEYVSAIQQKAARTR
ncbi:MAG: hypothetical protein V7642_1774 [Burkholderiales bacterium]|jgi:hypothetical protein